MGARVRLLCEFTGTVVSVLPKMAATYRYDTGIRVPAGIGIPVWLLSRYEHPYDDLGFGSVFRPAKLG